jgi:hypothetical protein
MKNFLVLFLIGWSFHAFSQNDYFQQEVNYKIDCALDDIEHILTGTIEMEYTNNSPDDLDFIYMHLWGNAFKDINTAFAKQKLREGSTRFYFAKDSQFGYYADLDFQVNGETIEWNLTKKNEDIAKLMLKSPLKSGQKIVISTPFKLKIPASFSRLGHVRTSYQMTQWYPKPAVYDKDGWHPMPYLDMGEFYSEFGSFDVKITLPENYVVGATGELQTASEKAFLDEKVEETKQFFKEIDKQFKADFQVENYLSKLDTFPKSSEKFKTIQYKAENVHDFAWFADKRFHVQKDQIELASGKKVDTWTMFSNSQADLWEKSIEYVNRSVKFYSDKVGEYPWPQATAVHSALSAGGGMEYPMITVIGQNGTGKDLDDVITHEVGHNWFYGILATNERDHPWMDEGMNSYYEYRYMAEHYDDIIPVEIPEYFKSDVRTYEVFYQFQARRGLDQAPETASNDFNSLNYGLSAYVKPGLVFGHLEQYLGTENFDKIMQSYYEKWKFKHPTPADFRVHFEAETGKDLSWFFDGYINSNGQLDYAVNSVSTGEKMTVSVKNKGDINAPFPISGMKDSVIVRTEWFDGFEGEKTFDFPVGDYDRIVIDANQDLLEVNRKNNNYKTSGLLKKMEPFSLKFLGSMESSEKSELFWLPTPMWNAYDKFMPSFAFYNSTIPMKKFEFLVMPAYSFKTKDLNGVGNLAYNIYPKSGVFQKIRIGANVKSFNYDDRDSLQTETGFEDTALKYLKVQPSISFDFRKSATSNLHQNIQFRSIWLNQEQTVFEIGENSRFYVGNTFDDVWIHELSYTAEMRRALNPYRLKVTAEQMSFRVPSLEPQKESSVKLTLEYETSYTYAPRKSLDIRFFVGGFLQNPFRNRGLPAPNMLNLTSQGFNDYKYDDSYFGRNERDGLWSQQIHLNDGGMKFALGGGQSFPGRSNNFMFAINLEADLPQDLPLNLPLKPYLDIGYFDDARPNPTYDTFDKQLWWSGGFMLDFFDGIVGVYFPVINSKNGTLEISGEPDPNGLRSLYRGQGNYWSRISFHIDFNRLNPWRALDRMEL